MTTYDLGVISCTNPIHLPICATYLSNFLFFL
nr:MAG TPA: hypothetical protein [Caudoviricetes sp.]